jgi:hypothetical protein
MQIPPSKISIWAGRALRRWQTNSNISQQSIGVGGYQSEGIKVNVSHGKVLIISRVIQGEHHQRGQMLS